jgi:NADPH-dependent 2,4-dienoyl-CoA reductase/sulfur reductase-like enzyme
VWGVGDDGHTLLTCAADGAAEAATLTGRYVVVATGAYERVSPFPGWELPGVTTAGFAQHLAAADGTAIGRRVLLAGSGPFLLPVACSLLELGVTVVGIAEAGQPYRLSAAGAATALSFPARLRELAGYAARLARHRVPLWQGRVVARADPDETGQHVGSVSLAATTAPATPLASFRIDALCVGLGFRPQAELAQLLGCSMRPDPGSGDLLPVIGPDGRSSRPDVYVAGEAAAIGGAHLATAAGSAVAAAILAREGRPARAPRARRRRQQQRFAARIGRLYPPAGELAAGLARMLPDEVRVCRCEAVTAGQVRAAARITGAAGITDAGAVRGLSRAGMGPCQGRECSATVAALAGTDPARAAMARMPVRPVPLTAVAALRAAPPAAQAGPGLQASPGVPA